MGDNNKGIFRGTSLRNRALIRFCAKSNTKLTYLLCYIIRADQLSNDMICCYLESAFYDWKTWRKDVSERCCPRVGTECASDYALPVVQLEMKLMLIYPSLGLPEFPSKGQSRPSLAFKNFKFELRLWSSHFTRLVEGISMCSIKDAWVVSCIGIHHRQNKFWSLNKPPLLGATPRMLDPEKDPRHLKTL